LEEQARQPTFAEYLFQGRGGAYLLIRQDGEDPYRGALLRACLYNPVYDSQCTGSRAGYLLAMLDLAGDTGWYEEQMLTALADPDDEMDLDQLFDFALAFARRGSRRARQLMYERAAELASAGDIDGASQLVELDGLDGFLWVARHFGEAIECDPELWFSDHLLRQLEGQLGAEPVHAMLARARAEQPFVDHYLRCVERVQSKRHAAAQQRAKLIVSPYSEIKAYLGTCSSLAVMERWGEQASDEDLARAAQQLFIETDPRWLEAHLQIFQRRRFPLPARLLIPFVWHERERVARRAIGALAQFQDAEIRALAFDLIAANRFVGAALELFERNYQAGDEQRFAELLERAADDDEVHSAGFGIIDIFKQNRTTAAANLLFTLYERGPCSLCRTRVVERLIEIDRVPNWLAMECQHDAEEDIRELINQYLASH
jgi:hypothetical protein